MSAYTSADVMDFEFIIDFSALPEEKAESAVDKFSSALIMDSSTIFWNSALRTKDLRSPLQQAPYPVPFLESQLF